MRSKEEVSEDASKGKKIKVLCPQCQKARRQTNHEVLKSYRITYTETGDENNGKLIDISDFQIIQCQGCETITFREISWVAFDGIENLEETLYPERSFNNLKAKLFPNLPRKIREIYKETLYNYNAENFILCAAGLRAIVESICTNQGIEDGPEKIEKPDGKRKKNLECKIYGLAEKGILSKDLANILHEHRFLGNSALHELEKPSEQDLMLAIGIIEHILESVFEMPVKGNVLRAKRTNPPEVEVKLGF